MLSFLDKRSRTVFAFALVGMSMALIASQINSMMLVFSLGDYLLTTTNLTPVSEEILKAIPVLFFTFVIAEKKDEITPVAYAVGVGFAILENVTIFLQSVDSIDILWVISRSLGAGLMHGICTASVGIGMSFVKFKRKLFVPGTFALLTFAILYHSIFNSLVQSDEYKYFGIILPVLTYIPMVILFIRKKKKNAASKKESGILA